MRPVSEIIVHCSATRPDWMAGSSVQAKRDEIRRWHTSAPRNWSDIGYHYVIDRDGSGADGRPLERIGAHVRGRNTGSIGVCLLGGHGSSERDQFSDNFTPEQDAALRRLIDSLQRELGPLKVTGHNQYAAKACPGFDVPSWFDGAPMKRVTSELPEEVAQVIKDADKPPMSSTSLWAILAGLGGQAWMFWQSADTETRAAIVVGVLALLWLFQERIRKMRLGRLAKAVMG